MIELLTPVTAKAGTIALVENLVKDISIMACNVHS